MWSVAREDLTVRPCSLLLHDIWLARWSRAFSRCNINAKHFCLSAVVPWWCSPKKKCVGCWVITWECFGNHGDLERRQRFRSRSLVPSDVMKRSDSNRTVIISTNVTSGLALRVTTNQIHFCSVCVRYMTRALVRRVLRELLQVETAPPSIGWEPEHVCSVRWSFTFPS